MRKANQAKSKVISKRLSKNGKINFKKIINKWTTEKKTIECLIKIREGFVWKTEVMENAYGR